MAVQSSIPIDAVYLDGRVNNILLNSVGSMEDDTVVKTSDSGLVEANERWDRIKKHWNLSWGPASTFIENLFEVCRQSRGFLWISPRSEDRVARGQAIGTGNGSQTAFQLQVTKSTSAHSVSRDINYPLVSPNLGSDSAVVMYLNGAAKSLGSDFTVSATTGLVTFTVAPGSGVAITADFSFAWPAKFSSNTISTTYLQADQVEVRSVPIEEVF